MQIEEERARLWRYYEQHLRLGMSRKQAYHEIEDQLSDWIQRKREYMKTNTPTYF